MYILVKHTVKDYSKFRKAFFGNFKRVKNNGSRGGFVLRNGKEVWVLVKWKNLASFQRFAKSPEILKDTLKKATIIGKPKGWIFKQAEKF